MLNYLQNKLYAKVRVRNSTRLPVHVGIRGFWKEAVLIDYRNDVEVGETAVFCIPRYWKRYSIDARPRDLTYSLKDSICKWSLCGSVVTGTVGLAVLGPSRIGDLIKQNGVRLLASVGVVTLTQVALSSYTSPHLELITKDVHASSFELFRSSGDERSWSISEIPREDSGDDSYEIVTFALTLDSDVK